MSKRDLEKIIQIFISSRLGYYNSLFSGLPKKAQLQVIQYAAARVLTKIKENCKYYTSSQISALATSVSNNLFQNIVTCLEIT